MSATDQRVRDLKQRFTDALKLSNMSLRRLSMLLDDVRGSSRGQLRNYRDGKFDWPPNRVVLTRAATEMGFRHEWLIDGEGPPTALELQVETFFPEMELQDGPFRPLQLGFWALLVRYKDQTGATDEEMMDFGSGVRDMLLEPLNWQSATDFSDPDLVAFGERVISAVGGLLDADLSPLAAALQLEARRGLSPLAG